MLKNGTIFAERYGIIEKIGSGGMADVYKAQDTKTNQLVAIKVLKASLSEDESFVHRFRVEGRAAAGLNNPNVISVYDVGNVGDTYYIVMELVSGITLKEYIRRKGRLSARETMAIGAQVSVGLRAAHAHHIVHRDIKPQNIILSRDGKVKISDFGIAKAASDETKTVTTTAMGSVHYIAPEQAKGSMCDERSDIYSLGICMYEMITGQVPFDKDTSIAVALAHMNETMVPPSELNPECPVALEQIIFRCTQKARERRYHNCTELLKDLKIAVNNPDFDFEKQEEEQVKKGSTRIFSAKEMNTLRNGTKGAVTAASLADTVRIDEDALEEVPPVTVDAAVDKYQEAVIPASFTEEEDDEEDYAERSAENLSTLFSEDRREDERTLFDRIMMIAGIVMGALIVCLAIYIIAGFSGCIQRGNQNPGETTSRSREDNENNSPNGLTYRPQPTDNPEETETVLTVPEDEFDPERDTIVPDVVGSSVEAAINLLKEAGLNFRISSVIENSDDYGYGLICRQNSEPGTIVAKGTTILIYMSAGSDKFQIKPSYIGGPLSVFRDAIAQYEDIISVEYIKENSDTVRANYIISIEPSSGLVKSGDHVRVVYSAGPEYVYVPNVVGYSKTYAGTILMNEALYVGNITYDYSNTVEDNCVISQQYPAGTRLKNGSSVDLVISKGVRTESLPDVYGWSLTDAEKTLKELGFGVEVEYDFDADMQENIVLRQDPEGNRNVPYGTTVILTVNRKTAKLPNVIGKKIDEAKQILEEAGFKNYVLTEEKTNKASKVGLVKSQSPKGGKQVPKDTKIELVYYIENPGILLPTVVNYQLHEGGGSEGAVETLQAAGFTNIKLVEEITDDPNLDHIVKSMSPEPGKYYPEDTEIVIVYYVVQHEEPSESESSDTEPEEPTEPSDSSEPTDSSEDTEPTETEPTEPSEPSEPSESSEDTEPSESSSEDENPPGNDPGRSRP